jgi:hypothetical protein
MAAYGVADQRRTEMKKVLMAGMALMALGSVANAATISFSKHDSGHRDDFINIIGEIKLGDEKLFKKIIKDNHLNKAVVMFR